MAAARSLRVAVNGSVLAEVPVTPARQRAGIAALAAAIAEGEISGSSVSMAARHSEMPGADKSPANQQKSSEPKDGDDEIPEEEEVPEIMSVRIEFMDNQKRPQWKVLNLSPSDVNAGSLSKTKKKIIKKLEKRNLFADVVESTFCGLSYKKRTSPTQYLITTNGDLQDFITTEAGMMCFGFLLKSAAPTVAAGGKQPKAQQNRKRKFAPENITDSDTEPVSPLEKLAVNNSRAIHNTGSRASHVCTVLYERHGEPNINMTGPQLMMWSSVLCVLYPTGAIPETALAVPPQSNECAGFFLRRSVYPTGSKFLKMNLSWKKEEEEIASGSEPANASVDIKVADTTNKKFLVRMEGTKTLSDLQDRLREGKYCGKRVAALYTTDMLLISSPAQRIVRVFAKEHPEGVIAQLAQGQGDDD